MPSEHPRLIKQDTVAQGFLVDPFPSSCPSFSIPPSMESLLVPLDSNPESSLAALSSFSMEFSAESTERRDLDTLADSDELRSDELCRVEFKSRKRGRAVHGLAVALSVEFDWLIEAFTARVVTLSVFNVSLSLEKFPALVELPKSIVNLSSPDARVSSFIVAFRWVEFVVEFMESEAFNFYIKSKHKKLP